MQTNRKTDAGDTGHDAAFATPRGSSGNMSEEHPRKRNSNARRRTRGIQTRRGIVPCSNTTQSGLIEYLFYEHEGEFAS